MQLRNMILAPVALISSLALAQSTSGSFKGFNAPACYITPVIASTTFVLKDDDKDGFPEKLSAEDANHRLQYTMQCNGAKVTISFGHPQKTSGPAVTSGTRYHTVLSTTRDGGKSITSTNSTETTSYIIQKNSNTTPQSLYFYFAIRNGAEKNIPLVAGEYIYMLTTTISASL